MQCGCSPGHRPLACLRVSAERAQTINYTVTLTQYIAVVNRNRILFCAFGGIGVWDKEYHAHRRGWLTAYVDKRRWFPTLYNFCFFRVVFSHQPIVDIKGEMSGNVPSKNFFNFFAFLVRIWPPAALFIVKGLITLYCSVRLNSAAGSTLCVNSSIAPTRPMMAKGKWSGQNAICRQYKNLLILACWPDGKI